MSVSKRCNRTGRGQSEYTHIRATVWITAGSSIIRFHRQFIAPPHDVGSVEVCASSVVAGGIEPRHIEQLAKLVENEVNIKG